MTKLLLKRHLQVDADGIWYKVTLDLFVLTSMEGAFAIPQRATACIFEGRSAATLGLVT